MRKIFYLFVTAFLFTTTSFAQRKITTSEYISIYQDLACKSMQEYGIPASIKMAQAIVESASGNSVLAVRANNHFGIKCKEEWKGETISHDDDAKGECFRKYSDPYESFKDHSEFLTTRDRYNSLFQLDVTDYKAWARGLKAAGYATNPQYAEILIRTIETNKLYELDQRVLSDKEEVKEEEPKPKEKEKPVVIKKQDVIAQSSGNGEPYLGPRFTSNDFMIAKRGAMPIYKNNNVMFVIAGEGDTFSSIAKRMRISMNKLLKLNDLKKEPREIRAGVPIYISAKKKKAGNGFSSHIVSKGETLHFISQKYGIKLANTASLNNMTITYSVKPGQKIKLK